MSGLLTKFLIPSLIFLLKSILRIMLDLFPLPKCLWWLSNAYRNKTIHLSFSPLWSWLLGCSVQFSVCVAPPWAIVFTPYPCLLVCLCLNASPCSLPSWTLHILQELIGVLFLPAFLEDSSTCSTLLSLNSSALLSLNYSVKHLNVLPMFCGSLDCKFHESRDHSAFVTLKVPSTVLGTS